MSKREVRPYGTWTSPLPTRLLVEKRLSLADTRFDHGSGAVTWLESRPWQGGRQVLVRWTPEMGTSDVTADDMNVRTRVHEYGGAPYLVHDDLIVVSDFTTGRLLLLNADGSSRPITAEGDFRYADMVLDAARGELIAVREDHSGGGEPASALVAIPLGGDPPRILAADSDFAAAPRLAPDGQRLAWIRWNHPNMPWDGTELVVASVEDNGQLGVATVVAGSTHAWVSQPRWSPTGVLHFVAEPTGWMNIYRATERGVEPVTMLEAEFAIPEWSFGLSNYAFRPEGSIVAVGRSLGRDQLYHFPPGDAAAEIVDLPFTEMGSVDVVGDSVVLEAASPSAFASVVLVHLRDGSFRVLRTSSESAVDPADISIPESIDFPTVDGRIAHALFYPPTSQRFEAPVGERPPLVVGNHGGPTGQAYTGLTFTYQHFTSRGIAFLDVDYGGSSGYGRDYRKRLEGNWGVVDVDDCVAAAEFLARRGDVDADRMAVRGGSAGGFTTLAALAFRDSFQAGISYFGIGDLRAFARETHKFESRYVDRLVGPWPAAEALYLERSPSFHTGRMSAPVLVIQGADDRITPASEAERIVAALAERSIPHAYLLIEGEDHGFRKEENILRAYEAELSFLSQIFGFELADRVDRLEIPGLEHWIAERYPSRP
jgi:Prolyl oligopeptidase family.